MTTPEIAGSRRDGVSRQYAIEHRTVYSYSDEVSASYGRGYLRPRDLPWQRCISHQVTTKPAAADSSVGVDLYGNSDYYFHVTTSHRRLEVISTSLVEVHRPAVDQQALGLPWERARPQFAGEADVVDFVVPSPRIDLSDAVRGFAEESFTPGRAIEDAVLDLTHRIHAGFVYKAGSTTVTTRVMVVSPVLGSMATRMSCSAP